MVEYLKGLTVAGLLAAATLSGAARAEDLPDPTRPPAELALPVPGAAAGPVLQSVQISPQGRFAIISGQRVKLGDAYGEARVVKISEGEVVLKSGSELQTLKLFPGVEKRVRQDRIKDRKTKP